MMQQNELQMIRSLVKKELDRCHGIKVNTNALAKHFYREATPDTDEGVNAYSRWKKLKNHSRSLSRRIKQLDALTKTLKKEMNYNFLDDIIGSRLTHGQYVIGRIDGRGWYISESPVSYLYTDGSIRSGVNLGDGKAKAFWRSYDNAESFLRRWIKKNGIKDTETV